MNNRNDIIRIGTAGWSIPKSSAQEFDGQGTHLQRYAQCLPAVEINSSFYRPHKPETYARWAASVPAGFRFSVKIPKDITHTCRLIGIDQQLGRFLGEVQSNNWATILALCWCSSHPVSALTQPQSVVFLIS